MELKDFVKNSIVEITKALSEAQEEIKDLGGTINPIGVITSDTTLDLGAEYSEKVKVQDIEFNILVNETAGEGTKAGIGVLATVFTAGVSQEGKSEVSNATSIKFSVPIIFPGNRFVKK